MCSSGIIKLSVFQALHINIFSPWCFNFRRYNPEWQQTYCLREGRCLWRTTIPMKAPRLPTERLMPAKTSTPLTKTWTTTTTDPGRARARKAGLTLALKKTDFGPCKHDPSNTVLSSRTKDGERGKRGWSALGRRSWYVGRSWRIWMTGEQNQLFYFHGLHDENACFYIKVFNAK